MYKYHLVVSKSHMLRRGYFQKTGFHSKWGFWWLSLYFLIYKVGMVRINEFSNAYAYK